MSEFCSPACGYALANHRTRQAAERKRLREARELKARRVAIKKPVEWAADAQKAFNSFIRIRDAGLDCPSCGASEAEVERKQAWKPGGAWDAGHFRSRGAAANLRYNTFNCHRQCKSCNGGSGNWGHTRNKAETITQAYRETLVRRIGLERVEALEQNNEPRTFDIDYLKRVKRIFARRARHYRKIRGLA